MPFCKSLVKVTRLDDFSYRTDNLVDDITTINLVVPDEWIYNTVKFRMLNILVFYIFIE